MSANHHQEGLVVRFPWLARGKARYAKVCYKLARWHSGRGGIRHLRRLAKEGDWAELERAGKIVLQRFPDHPEALVLVVLGLFRQGKTGEARERAEHPAIAGWNDPHWDWLGIRERLFGGDPDGRGMAERLREMLMVTPWDQALLRRLVQAVAREDGIHAAATEWRAHGSWTGDCEAPLVAKLATVCDWASTAGIAVLEAGDAEGIPFQEPLVWNRLGPVVRHTALSNKPYVAEIPGARVFSRSDVILTRDGTALSDTGAHPRFGRYVSFAYDALVLAQGEGEVLLDPGGFKERGISEAVWLAGCAASHFGHWFPEYLPRLQFLRCHPDFARLPIIVDADMPQSHFDHLRRYADNPLILLKPGESLTCGRLLVTPQPAFSPVEWLANDLPAHELPGLSVRALSFLRESVPNLGSAARDGRYFLARRKMRWRLLENEAEIGEALAACGFETVYMEEMDMREQMALFRSAAWMVAPNGSALLNLIYADPGVKLLILSQSKLFNWGTFEGPMRSLGYSPVWLCGNDGEAEDSKHANYSVPVPLVLAALKDMGLPD